MFRTAIVFCIGLGLSLVSLVGTNNLHTVNFLKTPWQLPMITIAYFIVLILTHLPHPPRIFIKRSEVTELEMGNRDVDEARAEAERKLTQPAEETHQPEHLNRRMTLRRGLTSIHHAAKNIHIEPGRFDPVAEEELFFNDRRGAIRSDSLYRV